MGGRIPGRYYSLGTAVRNAVRTKKLEKPIVTVLFNGRPLAIPEIVEMSDALVEAWHLGSEAGNAVADVLFGDYNPSARLTMTFPHKSGECPIY